MLWESVKEILNNTVTYKRTAILYCFYFIATMRHLLDTSNHVQKIMKAWGLKKIFSQTDTRGYDVITWKCKQSEKMDFWIWCFRGLEKINLKLSSKTFNEVSSPSWISVKYIIFFITPFSVMIRELWFKTFYI